MSTLQQKKVAKRIVEAMKSDVPVTGGDILENVGYSKAIVKNPKMVLESAGVKEALNELGFNEQSAKKVVEEIMLDSDVEPNARLKATDQVFKVHGSYAPEKSVSLNMTVDTKSLNPATMKLKEEYEKKLLETIQSE